MEQTTNNRMKAIALDHFGGVEALTVESLPVPEVGPDEIPGRGRGLGVWDPFEREGGFAEMSSGA